MSVGWSPVRAAAVAAGLLLLSAPGASADITWSGAVAPETVIADNPTEDLRIGEGVFPDDIDPRAWVRVDGGSSLLYDELVVTEDEGYLGYMYVDGAGTTATFDNGGAVVEVGRLGYGYLSVTDGASFFLTSSSGNMLIATGAGSEGEMLVDGDGTFVSLYDDVIVGSVGHGVLTVSGGAFMRTTDTDGVVTIGDSAGSRGEMYVDGDSTRFYVRQTLNVGGSGVGELHITNNAVVDADNTGSSQATVGALGSVRLSGGTLYVRDINVSGYVGGHGLVRGQVDVAAGGVVEVDAGQQLDFDGAFNNAGAVTVTEGELRLLGANSNTGEYTLEDGTVRFSADLTNAGVVASAGGVNNIHGEVTNNGTVVVASESVAVFNDAYTDNGTTTVLARGNALFLSDLTFTSNSLLSLQVTEEGAGQIQVAGATTLAGELAVSLSPEIDLDISQSIELLSADGGLSGEFIPPVFPNIEGVDFGLTYGATSLTLDITVDQVGVLLDGDFNDDGIVDAADYTVWRDGLGTIYSQQDYDVWVSNYGQTNAPVAQGSTTAPSPSGLACLLAAAACGAARRRR